MSFHPIISPITSVDPITITQTHTASNDGAAVTQSFSSCSIGTAAANRKVVVLAFPGYGGADNSGTPTIDGEDATWVAGGDSHTTLQFIHCAIFELALATGTSVTITFPTRITGTRYFASIIVYAVYGAGAAHATAISVEDTPPPMSASLAIPKNGIAIGGCGYQPGSAPVTTFTWSNLDEDLEALMWVFSSSRCTGAHRIVEAAETPTITCLPSNSDAYNGRGMMTLVSYVNDN